MALLLTVASKGVQFLQPKPNYVKCVTFIFLTVLDSSVYLMEIYEVAQWFPMPGTNKVFNTDS